MGYNFGCVMANSTIFDSRGWVFGVRLSDEDIADFEVLRDVAKATSFGTKIAVTGFVNDSTRRLVMEGSLSGQPTKCRYC